MASAAQLTSLRRVAGYNLLATSGVVPTSARACEEIGQMHVVLLHAVTDASREVLVPLQGLALPAEVWEREVLPRRTGAYSPSWMDQLCASGQLVWIGAGALGRHSGRVALYFREDASVLGLPTAPRWAAGEGDTPQREAVRRRLAAGACFFTDLLVDVDLTPEELQEALWELVWAGGRAAARRRQRAGDGGAPGARFPARWGAGGAPRVY